MLHDVVATVAAWPRRPACALVTGDPFAVDLARQYDFEVIPDPANPGETGAIEMATNICVARGIDSTLVIPADIPLIQASELEEILNRAPKEGSVLAPAADGRGTNAVFRRPANLFPLRFGNDSFKPHLAAAQATGKLVHRIAAAGNCSRCGQSRRPAASPRTPRRNPHPEPASAVDAGQPLSCDRNGGPVSKARSSSTKPGCSAQETIGHPDPRRTPSHSGLSSPTKSAPAIRSPKNCCKPCGKTASHSSPATSSSSNTRSFPNQRAASSISQPSNPLRIRLPGRKNTTWMPASSSLPCARAAVWSSAEERRAHHRDASRFYLRQQWRGCLQRRWRPPRPASARRS